MTRGQLTVVIEQANKLTIKYPNSFAIWNILGAAAARIKQMDKALSAFQSESYLSSLITQKSITTSVMF